MRTVLLALLGAVALAGCECVDVSELQPACEADGGCLDGKVCCSGRCAFQCGTGGGSATGGGVATGGGAASGGGSALGGGQAMGGGGATGGGSDDGGSDGGVDGGSDGGLDGGSDGGSDAGSDGGSDAGTDGGLAPLCSNCPSGSCCASDGGCEVTGILSQRMFCSGARNACVDCGLSANNCGPNGECRCGSGGACAVSQVCTGGVCVCDSTGASCPNGCCKNNLCVPLDPGNCRISSVACGACGPGADRCVFTASGSGCRCGTSPACPAGERCQNGQCICDSTSGCVSGCCGLDKCISQSAASCGLGSSCSSCGTGTCDIQSGVCSNCPANCTGCCSGGQCQPVAFPNCMGAVSQACDLCAAGRASRCNLASQACACGTGPQCSVGEKCIGDGGAQDRCECDRTACRGCCVAGDGGSRCVGTISQTFCAVAPMANQPANDCTVCPESATSACVNGQCRCAGGPACDAGFRCYSGQCVP